MEGNDEGSVWIIPSLAKWGRALVAVAKGTKEGIQDIIREDLE